MRCAHLGLLMLSFGCSAVLPLGDEYTFERTDGSPPPDGGPPMDGQMEDDAGPPDMGPVCDEIPTQEEACAGLCGEVEVCEMTFTCGGCEGELSCGGGGTDNTCGCADPPCAVVDFQLGDVDRQVVVGVAVDGEGNVFIAGDFRGTITFGDDTHTNPGATRYDMFLAKLDPQGNPLWSRSYGGLGDVTGADSQNARALAVDAAGNVILVGESFGPINLGGSDLAAEADLVILKLDGDGNHIFSASYGSDSGIDPVDVAIDPSSQDIVLTGRFYGTLKFGGLSSMTAANPGGNWDIFLVRFSPAGTPERSKRYGDTAEQSPESVSVAGSSVYLSAYFTGDFDFGAPNVTPLSTTSFYALALTKLSTGFLSHEWSRQIGESVFGSRLATDTAGNLYVAGGFAGALDIDTPALDSADGDTFLARLDPDGNTEWTKQFANVVIQDLAVGPDQTLYVVGRADDEVDLGDGPVPGSGNSNVFIARYAADGSHLWSRVFTAPVGNQFPSAIDVGADGATWVAADIEGQVDFGTGTLTTEGDRDVVVVGYAP